MNDDLLESANLYVLGLLTEDAQVAFEHELFVNPTLQKEVHTLQECFLALAMRAPQIAPPPDLRAILLASFPTASAKPAPMPAAQSPAPSAESGPSTPFNIIHLIPWAAAAALAVMLYQNRDAAAGAGQQVAAAEAKVAEFQEREKHFSDAVRLSEAAKASTESALAEARDHLAKAEKTLSELAKNNQTLLAEVNLLRSDSKLDKTRIAVLGSLLKNQPQAVAVSLWRQERQEGLLVVENLPALPKGRDYQLWVIDPNLKTPVSAGVFKVDNEGKVRLEFKPDRQIRSAYKFAVTMEKEGGSVLPTMDQMVVIGG